MRTLESLLEGGAYFEGPRWHDGRWWVSDIHRHIVLAIEPGGGCEEVLTVAGRPSGLGWLPDGSLLVVSMLEHTILRVPPSGDVEVHAALAAYCGGPLNDMVVDERGRAYVGNRGFETGEPFEGANLIRVEPDGSSFVAAGDLAFPNGTVISADGTMLIVSESLGSRHTAFTIAANGDLVDRRVWAQLDESFAPDGCTLDAAGRMWSADPRGGRFCLLEQGGTILEEIPAPTGKTAVACMLGGDDGRTLLLCAATMGAGRNHELRDAVLLTTRVDVAHAGCP